LPEHELYDEHTLLLKIATGDQKAFNLVFDKYRLPVYAHVLSITKSPERAEEITQDIFVKIWDKRAELSSINSFSDWLFIITRNYSLSELRKALAPRNIQAEDSLASAESPIDGLILKETDLLIQKAIQQLPARRKQIFILSRMELKSHREIASEMGITPGTVNIQLVQALVFIRNFLHAAQKNNKNFTEGYIYLLFGASLLT